MTLEDVNALQTTLLTRGWQIVLKPALTRLRDGAVNQLLVPVTSERKFSDDYIKGQANVLNWMLGWDQRSEALSRELSELEAVDNQRHVESSGSPYVPQPDGQPVGAL